jgi:hypothetical protein
MKTVFLLLALLCTGHGALTASLPPDPGQEAQATAQPPVYYTGNDEPAASMAGDSLAAVHSAQAPAAAAPAAPAEKAAQNVTPPVYFTGRDEPAASGLFIAE